MERQYLTFAQQLHRVIINFPDLKYDGTAVRCLVCRKSLKVWKLGYWREHLETPQHRERRKRQFPYWSFVYDFMFVLDDCILPQNVINNQLFRLFWEKYVPDWILPTRKQVAREFPHLKEIIENYTMCMLRGRKLWITINETSDVKHNKIINVLIRTLSMDIISKPFLIASKRLAHTNSGSIFQLVQRTLAKFGVHKGNVLVLVTNGAPNIFEAGTLLKTTCPNLLNISCILYIFQQVIETIQMNYPNLDKLISGTKCIKDMKRLYKLCPELPELPSAPLNRIETWLKAAFYYNKHFQKIKSIVSQIDLKKTRYAENYLLFYDLEIEANLLTLCQNYGFLVDAVEILQEGSLSLHESLEIIDNVTSSMQNLKDEIGVLVAEQFNNILHNNPDYVQLRVINKCINEGRVPSKLQRYYAHVNITSLDVERSLSSYAAIFKSKDIRLTQGAVETILMMKVYSQKKKLSVS